HFLGTCPILHRRVVIRFHAAAGLPDRTRWHVAYPRLPFPVAFESQACELLQRIVRRGKHVQGSLQFRIEPGVEEADALHFAQFHAAHPLGTDEIEQVDFAGAATCRLHLRFHPHDHTGNRAGLVHGRLLHDHFDLLAGALVQYLAEGWVASEIDREAAQRFFNRILPVVTHDADFPLAQVLQDHALEQVVHVADGELQIDAGVAFDFALALKVADPAAEEDDLRQRQAGGRRIARVLLGYEVRGRVAIGYTKNPYGPDGNHRHAGDGAEDYVPAHERVSRSLRHFFPIDM